MYNIYINNTIGFSENSTITYYNEVAKRVEVTTLLVLLIVYHQINKSLHI